MSGGFGVSESGQSSQSNSGISNAYKDQLSADAYNRQTQLGQAAQNAYNSRFGYFSTPGNAPMNGAQMLGLDPMTGLPSSFGSYLTSMANNMFNRASAGGAMRGQVTPENTSGVVGSAIQGLGAQALPYVSQFAQLAATLPEQMTQQRLGYLQAAAGNDAALLGGSSNYSGSSFGLNMQGGVGKA